MSLIGLLIFVIILGLIFWVIGMIPIPAPFKTIAYVVLAVIILIYLLEMLGALGPIGTLRLH